MVVDLSSPTTVEAKLAPHEKSFGPASVEELAVD
jgi:hypothetical protein